MSLAGEHEFARYHTDTEIGQSPMTSPFQAILGADFGRLPEPVRRLHGLAHDIQTAGRAEITVTPGLLPSLLCRLAGLPRAGQDVPEHQDERAHADAAGGLHVLAPSKAPTVSGLSKLFPSRDGLRILGRSVLLPSTLP